MNLQDFNLKIQNDQLDPALIALYGEAQLSTQKTRYVQMATRFIDLFPHHQAFDVFSASGRIEVGGNHTDHQLGRVLAMAVDLDTVAFAHKNEDGIIRFFSKDYTIQEIDARDLNVDPKEFYTTEGLLRGMAYFFKESNGLVGGFDAYVESTVRSGSGLSSSASVEVLIAKILDVYYGHGALSKSDYAILAQKAENHYFNKPCGLMDQMVIAHGGFCAIDFFDPKQPIVQKVDAHGMLKDMDLCLVLCGGSHADLSNDYAAIFEDCKALSAYFDQSVLSRVEPKQFYARLPQLYAQFDSRILLRGHHFFQENQRVLHLMQALETADLAQFLQLLIDSGRSSQAYLQNVWNPHESRQGLAMALMMAETALKGVGAYRVHGGGFAGTILMVAPKSMSSSLEMPFNQVFGEHSFMRVRLREDGVCQVF